MPKKQIDGRARRERDRQAAANLHEDATRTARKLSYTAQGRRRLIRRVIGLSLVTLGLLTIATHLVVHLANIHWLPTTGMQDLLTGYPMGSLVLLGGVMVLSR